MHTKDECIEDTRRCTVDAILRNHLGILFELPLYHQMEGMDIHSIAHTGRKVHLQDHLYIYIYVMVNDIIRRNIAMCICLNISATKISPKI